MTPALRIGTRGSPLALAQARAVASRLAARGIETTIVPIRTAGDVLGERSAIGPAPVDGKRLFVREIQDALLAGTVDLAVHSSKDMPAAPVDGLRIVATLPREDPRDAVILPAPAAPLAPDDLLAALSGRPRLGTSSVRRVAQLRRHLPGARFDAVRGNVGTRLQKLDEGQYDALVLAAAGLRRLGVDGRITTRLPIDVCLPAPGQGIVAIEARADDARVADLVSPIGDPAAAAALTAEQAVVRRLEGGCQMPIGACARLDGDDLVLDALVISLDGAHVARTRMRGPAAAADAVGSDAAADLLAHGARDILAEVRRARADAGPGTT